MSLAFLFLLLLAGLGEFLEANVAAIISGIVGFLGGAIAATFWLARLESKVKELAKDLAKLTEQTTEECEDLSEQVKKVEMKAEQTGMHLNNHLRDSDSHVNKPYIGALERRIEKLETSVSVGHSQINSKLDTLLVATASIHRTS